MTQFKDWFDQGKQWFEGNGENNGGTTKSEPPPTKLKITFLRVIIPLIGILLLFCLAPFTRFYTNYLWYDSHQYASVFWTRFFVQAGLFISFSVLSCLIYWVNWKKAWKNGSHRMVTPEGNIAQATRFGPLVFAIPLAFINGFAAQANWEPFLRYLYLVPFGSTDYIFKNDLSFYVFSLPFWRFILDWVNGILWTSLIGCLVIYRLTRGVVFEGGRFEINSSARTHFTCILSAMLLSFGVGFWLDRYSLLFSSNGVVFRAGYTDIKVLLPAITLLAFTALFGVILLCANLAKPMWKISLVIMIGLGAISIASKSFIPNIVQLYVVGPNEYEMEKPYLAEHIQATRMAYGLDKLKTYAMIPKPSITIEDVKANMDTIENIRLWDYDPLLRTYKQLQEIRTYYDFVNIDIDRYNIDGKIRQVMLSVRELDPLQIQNPTWVNTHLEFTHGYGVVMNPVNEVAEGGMPVLFMKDLPPKSSVPIKIDRAQIYYGEKSATYALVKTDVKEFDYPMGDSNARSVYAGNGGVPLNSFFRRLMYAFKFQDSEIIFTSSLSPESRIMYRRNVRESVREIAPFLLFDDDIYPVIHEGRILWVQDAYTASGSYPYSRPLQGLNGALSKYHGINYIRNSVKITVDAYDGKMNFYVTDEKDPLIKNWMRIFPTLFKPASSVPQGLKEHFRYPEEFFSVQSEIYRIYHMTDTNTYYNREDAWETSPAGRERKMRPNYVTMQLEGEDKPEFALVTPFMPVGRNNLIGWMAGRSDPAHYGELIVYQFPKQEQLYGPSQIEALINQNPEISSQISLWSQRGSDVIRGDLLVIPIGKSLLYVQPLYLKAEKGDLPELKRVILSTGGRVAWAETFDAALSKLLGSEINKQITDKSKNKLQEQDSKNDAQSESKDKQLIKKARDHFDASQEAQKKGDWALYGEELKKLETTLRELENLR